MVIEYYCSDFQSVVKNFIDRAIAKEFNIDISELPHEEKDIILDGYSPNDILNIAMNSKNEDIKNIANAIYNSQSFNIETLETFYWCENKLLRLIGEIGIILHDDQIYDATDMVVKNKWVEYLSRHLSDKFHPEYIVNALIQINDYLESVDSCSILEYNSNILTCKIFDLIHFNLYDTTVSKNLTSYQYDISQLIRKLANYIYSKYVNNRFSEQSDTVNTWWIYRDGVYLELLTWNSSTREFESGYARTKKVIRIENIIIEKDSSVYNRIKNATDNGDINFLAIPVKAWNSSHIPLSELISIYSDYEDKFFDNANLKDNLSYNTLIMTREKEDAKKVYEDIMKVEVKPM